MLESERSYIPMYSLLQMHEVAPREVAAALQRLYADRSLLALRSRQAHERVTRPEYGWAAFDEMWRKPLSQPSRLDYFSERFESAEQPQTSLPAQFPRPIAAWLWSRRGGGNRDGSRPERIKGDRLRRDVIVGEVRKGDVRIERQSSPLGLAPKG